jgi:molybdopterin-guanine dinucleotide biosynthesis protein A
MQMEKAMLTYHGSYQTHWCTKLVQPFCQEVYLSIREEQAALPSSHGLLHIYDMPIYRGIGPMAGILSAMQRFPENAWLVVACDLPFLNEEVFKALLAGRQPKKCATAFRNPDNQLPEPLCAIYEPLAYQLMQEGLSRGIHCPRKFLLQQDSVLLDLINPSGVLDNVNYPQEYQNAITEIGGQPQATSKTNKSVTIEYYAVLREQRGTSGETMITQASTAGELYDHLARQHGFTLSRDRLKVAVNDIFCDWGYVLQDADCLIFIPPVSGG